MDNGIIGFIVSNMAIFWIAVAILFAIIEAITYGMVTIMFTIGAVPAAIVALFDVPITAQIVVFLIVSLLLLVFARPIFVKRLKIGREKNSIEQIEGKLGLVTEEIAPFKSGLVKVSGIIWTAIGENDQFHATAGEQVSIIRVEGVKLIVKKPNLEN